MDSELMLDVGQASEFKMALRRAGWTNADVKRLCEGNALGQLLPFIRGQAEVVVKKHIIDTDADPLVPGGWKVEEHRKGGQFVWDPAKVSLHLSFNQQNGNVIQGHQLRRELVVCVPNLNANVLDYLLAHPELIPESWMGKAIFFWGTIYRSADGDLCVRYLIWKGKQWSWGDRWLGSGWNNNNPAAVSASV
ncbi:MAG: hypothetical protein UT86_C0006G0024 [Candidatus Magasanikbacteria bacterium GW2011_GWC2_40_17]|uniref:Uncharacterized protein n=1 Tax=Candidatus Magasanikbacteria bacterium GW2011_GWA2_42_32 TaxID=1619039 RepID=A0A0G1D3T8_9BACT|nr:MAG: hypothetical protein UT86_C0006G0024 [Candidatus Magasanikbacteria bacterium GW2011_GWC2_40_17]KKS56648.1 MAG: hypothetical protein UV20_C0008G0024 [Candidatus Magasanikbacteria bacterium GW2011_GWA2_42_32]OGH86087.1 MAG: hypothetical protein A2294_04055 [Candidatus Magasanikbacteria bacterium RIFOXYB2_FULL_38_10]